MVDISHIYVLMVCVLVVIHKHTKIQQERCQNNVRFCRYGSFKIVICLIQREVISKIKGFGLQFRFFFKCGF